MIKQIKSNMNKAFDITYLGLLHYCLGVEVWKIGSNIFVLLDKFRIKDCKISSTPKKKGLKLSANTNSKAINESIFIKLL